MTRGIGALFLGAAMMSIFVPAPRGAETRPAAVRGAARSRRMAAPATTERASAPASRMLALVQTRPYPQVLAISESREELEREMQELNETWNHWEIRTERQRYEIQPAPVLRRVEEPNRRVASA